MTQPMNWDAATSAELGSIRGVCFDIDDTLSSHGKLTAAAYDSLWRLKEAGFALVPITGRPAGWCDHIARFWPVDAVVGENGAFSFYLEGGVRKRLDTPGADVDRVRKLEALKAAILARYPDARWASDQHYREHDLAIDFCEDVPRWPTQEVEALTRLCESQGAIAKVSSIHVNAWFGSFNKRAGLNHWFEAGMPGLNAKDRAPLSSRDSWIYIGDSPNDEPMFEWFESSVGVANLKSFLKVLRFFPKWMTEAESGSGFVQMADRLIAVRQDQSRS